MTVQETIRQLREQKNWSQEDMAERMGMSKNGYAKIERGESNLGVKRLQQIADILGISAGDLLENKNLICLISENSMYSSNYYGDAQALSVENEKLKLMLEHKEEIITQKDSEINTLRALVKVLQSS
ncbi:helix-turn-helix domain-containing protein [Psychrobacter sp. I-STPA6b]|uniref:helix-turn-helix domain-containing protein n=1 Tax=Psychrobacter sp. I-STPA6b TaxID=2585718 RepID=UPI001D0BF77D|nr:helix-turn-helix transcriptional regulator [Psychrobacter sp. I-STPA6b]